MTLQIDVTGYRDFIDNLTGVLKESVDEAIAETKERVHIVTGRLQSSIRHDEPEVSSDEISINLIAGGSVERGVFQEVGMPKEVDYALEEEVRHPQIRSHYPPAIKRAIAKRKKSS